MPIELRSASFAQGGAAIRSMAGKGALWLAWAFCGLLLGGGGCMTRSSVAVYGTDSTLVYPSKLANDIGASITFQVKDSALRDAERKRDKERAREITRTKRNRSKLLASIDKETERLAKAEAKRKAQEARKASKAKGKKGKKGKVVAAHSTENRVGRVPSAPAPPRPEPALRDSLVAIEARLRALIAEDSVASLATWKIRGPAGRPADERVVDLEDGARVQANILLENVYARGKRPLMFHFVWLNPERKRVFKKMIEYMPNDSTRTLSSSLTISPARRSSGSYAIQVFLFREEIAEKTITLRGAGVEEEEKGGGGGEAM